MDSCLWPKPKKRGLWDNRHRCPCIYLHSNLTIIHFYLYLDWRQVTPRWLHRMSLQTASSDSSNSSSWKPSIRCTGLEVGFLTLPVPSWTARGPLFRRHYLARCPLLPHWWQERSLRLHWGAMWPGTPQQWQVTPLPPNARWIGSRFETMFIGSILLSS